MKFSFLIVGFILTQTLFAQYDLEHVKNDTVQKEPLANWFEIKKRTYVGGDLSMRFGTLTYIYAAPLIGYDFYQKLSVGVTGIYQLYRLNNNGSVLTEHTVGAGVFLRYRPLDFLLLQTEFDILNTENYSAAPGNRINVPVLLAGGGYCGSLGSRAYYNMMLMFDFIHNPNMPVPRVFTNFPVYLRYGFAFYLG